MERFIRDRQIGGSYNRERRQTPNVNRYEISNFELYCSLMKRESDASLRSLWGGMMALERQKALAILQGLPEPTSQPQPDDDPLPQPEPQN